MKRFFDIFASGLGLIVLSPLFLILAIWIKLDSKGPVFYRQIRAGKDNKDFKLFKFRSMRPDSDKGRLITIGGRDPRVTRSGYYIRKYKLDEFPQLINVFRGEMSLVGPRPEVRRYVDLYDERQLKVLSVRPGITSLASIKYRNENDILAKAGDPDRAYVEIVMPAKLEYDLQYVEKATFWNDIKLIFSTLWAIVAK
ncbi:MAG: sugar transferase [Muribaculaceae bacterium]|nr:sugar transferase [Muribaculaceae bacterium]